MRRITEDTRRNALRLLAPYGLRERESDKKLNNYK